MNQLKQMNCIKKLRAASAPALAVPLILRWFLALGWLVRELPTLRHCILVTVLAWRESSVKVSSSVSAGHPTAAAATMPMVTRGCPFV